MLDTHPDITLARTPPGAFYRDPALFALQRERLFLSSWQLTPAVDRAREPSSVVPFTHLPGLLDEPLVAVRDADGSSRCLSNVCTHRGRLLVERPGPLATLRCGYHGRRFRLDGRCTHAPGFDDLDGAAPSRDDLRGAAIDRFFSFPFVSLAPRYALASLFEGAEAHLAHLPFASLVYAPAEKPREFVVRAHWALYVENYLEGLHVPFVHPGLSRALAMGAYRTEVFARSVLQVGIAREGESALLEPSPREEPGARVAAYYLWVFPNTMINVYPWGVSVNVVLPEAVDRTRVRYERYLWSEALASRGAGGDLDTVELEDDAVVESVHAGVGARLYDRGRYAPGWEAGVHAFHRMITAVSAEDPAAQAAR